jgi:hypothetical protein
MSHNVKFDSEFASFIEENCDISKICNIIRYCELKIVGDFIKKEEGNETISFIPKSKLNLESSFNDIKSRTPLKIGRFVSKFIKNETLTEYRVVPQDIEIFVNLYKSFFDRNESNLKIVEGLDILKYYHQDSYYRPNSKRIGTLWNSCMRYDEKNQYMEIYSKNPDKVKMLVFLSDDGKVRTRALLWEECKDEFGVTHKIMDRIYSVYDHDILFFKKWAFKNGYIHKLEQSAKTESIFMTPSGPKSIGLVVELKNHICDYYPYIDSFKFYSRKSGTLSNSESFNFDYILVQNDGGLYREEEPEEDLILDDDF